MLAREYVREDETIGEAAYRFLEEHVLTEKDTDFAIHWAQGRLSGLRILKVVPVPVGWLGRVLDKALPEKALELVRDLMISRGLLNARRVDPENPFR